jgi:hypothetical protein
MRKLELDKKYEFTIKAPDLESFHVEFSLMTENINYNIKLVNVRDNIFEMVIPSNLPNLPDAIDYSIQLFSKSNRFLVDSGNVELIRVATPIVAEEKEINIEINLLNEETKVEVTPTKKKIELADLVKREVVNEKVKTMLKNLKK